MDQDALARPPYLTAAGNLTFLAHAALLVLSYFVWDRAANLADMRNEPNRQRQIREWVDHPHD